MPEYVEREREGGEGERGRERGEGREGGGREGEGRGGEGREGEGREGEGREGRERGEWRECVYVCKVLKIERGWAVARGYNATLERESERSQGTLTEKEGSVRLTTLLIQVVSK